MARGDGIHRTSARNARMKDTDIDNAQAHNEREKSSYVNQDIVPERTPHNVHFKTPTAGYKEMFEQMRSDGVISTRGLKADAEKFGELIFDVNSAYFFNHGGYEFAKQFDVIVIFILLYGFAVGSIVYWITDFLHWCWTKFKKHREKKRQAAKQPEE